ncbi:hypothetical protein SDC9_99040 [bioreactor metagenome]|uniref:Uncharacterized protein n=1 Tax=bioreactor metagenome TaxID=1076179 RepID=A0A645AJ18_9ZZZZ
MKLYIVYALSLSDSIPFDDLCRQLQIVDGTKESLRPKNVGLLFFSENTSHRNQKYFTIEDNLPNE